MNFFKHIVIIVFIGLLAACSGTQTTASWSSTEEQGTLHSKKVAVLAIMDNLGVRQSFEQEMVAQLHKQSIGAVSAMDILSPKRKQRNVDQLIRALHQKGVDAVMVVSLSDVDRDKQYVPGTTYLAPRTTYRRFGDYYVHTYRRVRTPGYVRRSTTYFLESSLYSMQDQSLIWMGSAKTTDPNSLKNTSKSYAKSVVKSLSKEALI